MPGSVVTFYSYKGGVGRSFALANVAVILAQWGYRVLAVDWDIEAPGLNHYFLAQKPKLDAGVLDFLHDCKLDQHKLWNAYATPMKLLDCEDRLFLMPAAADAGRDYAALVQALDWDDLYRNHDFGARLETLRAQWVKEFDFVLVDSRTGVTDFSALTTAQIPDILAFLFTANEQSLAGCCDIVRRAMEARRRMPVDRPALLPLPIPAKFDQREEYDRARAWRKRFAIELSEFYGVWSPKDIDITRLVDLLTIPYVARWTFGEELAVLSEPASAGGIRSPSFPVSYALETMAAVLANSFAKVDVLYSSRDEYVLTARAVSRARDRIRDRRLTVFISAGVQDHKVTVSLAKMLADKGVEAFHDVDASDIRSGEYWEGAIARALERADALIALIGSGSTPTHQNREIEAFMRMSLRTDEPKPIIPVLLPGANLNNFPRLSRYRSIQFGTNFPDKTAFERVYEELKTYQFFSKFSSGPLMKAASIKRESLLFDESSPGLKGRLARWFGRNRTP